MLDPCWPVENQEHPRDLVRRRGTGGFVEPPQQDRLLVRFDTLRSEDAAVAGDAGEMKMIERRTPEPVGVRSVEVVPDTPIRTATRESTGSSVVALEVTGRPSSHIVMAVSSSRVTAM